MFRSRFVPNVLLCVAAAAGLAAPALAQTPGALVSRTIDVLQDVCTADPSDATLVDGSCTISQFSGPPEQQAELALQVSPREATAASSAATHTTDTQVALERDRLAIARRDAGPGGAPRWGGFLNGSGGFGTVDARGEAEEYDVWGGGVAAGIDRRLAEPLVAGIGVGWNRQNTEFDRVGSTLAPAVSVGGGEIESDAYTGSLYGSFFLDGLHLDGVLSYTWVDYEFERPVFLPVLAPPVAATARGDTDAHQLGVTFGGGYELYVGQLSLDRGGSPIPLGALSLGPLVQVSYRQTWIDGYRESGVPGFPLDYDDQRIRSLVTSLGGEASFAISTGFGVLLPHLRATWQHEFENDARNIDARLFLNDTDADDVLFTRTDSPDRDYFRLGAGLSVQLPRGIAAFVDYDTVLGLHHVSHHRFTAGGRIEL